MSSIEARADGHTPSEMIGSAAEPSCRVVQGCRGKRLVQIPQYGKGERWKTRKTLRKSAQVRLHQGTFMIREYRHPLSDGPLCGKHIDYANMLGGKIQLPNKGHKRLFQEAPDLGWNSSESVLVAGKGEP
jgi:hypothetical protein